MGVSYIAISAVCTALSFVGLQWWTEVSLDRLRSDGLIGENFINSENVNRARELLFSSYATIALLVNFVFNVFLLLNLCLKVSSFNFFQMGSGL
jgi:autocrine motility factor receptor